MKEFRKKLMESPPPDKIQKVIKSIIPPKGIGRKNVEDTELLDFSIEDATTSIEQDEPEVSEADEESDVDDDQPEAHKRKKQHLKCRRQKQVWQSIEVKLPPLSV